jgi:hypothetical protein
MNLVKSAHYRRDKWGSWDTNRRFNLALRLITNQLSQLACQCAKTGRNLSCALGGLCGGAGKEENKPVVKLE